MTNDDEVCRGARQATHDGSSAPSRSFAADVCTPPSGTHEPAGLVIRWNVSLIGPNRLAIWNRLPVSEDFSIAVHTCRRFFRGVFAKGRSLTDLASG